MQPDMQIWYRRMMGAGGRFSWGSGQSPIPTGIIWAERRFWHPCHGRPTVGRLLAMAGAWKPLMEAPAVAGIPVADVRGSEMILLDATLGFEWVFLRNPAPASRSLHEKSGASCAAREPRRRSMTPAPPLLWAVSLCHMSCNIAAALDFEPVIEGEEAGITIFMNDNIIMIWQ